jgi:hypothetical protein
MNSVTQQLDQGHAIVSTHQNTVEKSEAHVLQKQAEIAGMLRETVHLDNPVAKAGQCYLRHYHLTHEEYQQGKQFTFAIIFGGSLPSQEVLCEGIVYDVRQLLKERYFAIDWKVGTIPVPLSAARWNVLHKKYDLNKYSKKEGILEYPLLKSEFLVILRSLRSQVHVCSTKSAVVCLSADQPFRGVETFRFYDESEFRRYGPEIREDPLPATRDDIAAGRFKFAPVQPDKLPKKIEKVNRLLKKELQSMGFGGERIDSELASPTHLSFVRSSLASGNSEEAVVNTVVGLVLQNLLSNQ